MHFIVACIIEGSLLFIRYLYSLVIAWPDLILFTSLSDFLYFVLELMGHWFTCGNNEQVNLPLVELAHCPVVVQNVQNVKNCTKLAEFSVPRCTNRPLLNNRCATERTPLFQICASKAMDLGPNFVPVRVGFRNFCATEDRGFAVLSQHGYTFSRWPSPGGKLYSYFTLLVMGSDIGRTYVWSLVSWGKLSNDGCFCFFWGGGLSPFSLQGKTSAKNHACAPTAVQAASGGQGSVTSLGPRKTQVENEVNLYVKIQTPCKVPEGERAMRHKLSSTIGLSSGVEGPGLSIIWMGR